MAVHQLPSWLAFGVYSGTILVISLLMLFMLRSTSEEVNEFGNSNSSLWKI
jgi:hypothetical protein